MASYAWKPTQQAITDCVALLTALSNPAAADHHASLAHLKTCINQPQVCHCLPTSVCCFPFRAVTMCCLLKSTPPVHPSNYQTHNTYHDTHFFLPTLPTPQQVHPDHEPYLRPRAHVRPTFARSPIGRSRREE